MKHSSYASGQSEADDYGREVDEIEQLSQINFEELEDEKDADFVKKQMQKINPLAP